MSEPKYPSWIKIPKRYRVTKVGTDYYELTSSLPLALEIGRLPNLGPGLRAESQGWGTGAYWIHRISTEPLVDFEPELVHIPAGKFWMRESDKESLEGISPAIQVYLDAYWIGRYPVTIAEFSCFVDHYGHITSDEKRLGSAPTPWRQQDRDELGRHPVTMVSKADALAYCHWLSDITGRTYDLPTREKWEKAAYGTDAQKYPWGNYEPNRELCNTEHWFGGTTPVGKFSPAGDGPKFDNAYGCADMVGNVSEWTHSTYSYSCNVHIECDPDWYYTKTITHVVVCGTSWREGSYLHSKGLPYRRCKGLRYGETRDDVGFRVVCEVKNVGR